MWRQVTSCHIMTRHVTSCHVMSCHVTSHHRVSTLICLGPCWLRKEGDTVQAQFSVLHPCVMWYWNISLSMIISMAKIIDIDIGWTYQSKKTFSFQNLSYNSDLFIRIKLYTLNWHYLSVNCCMRIQQIVHYIQVCSNQCHWSTPFYQRCVAIGPDIWNMLSRVIGQCICHLYDVWLVLEWYIYERKCHQIEAIDLCMLLLSM